MRWWYPDIGAALGASEWRSGDEAIERREGLVSVSLKRFVVREVRHCGINEVAGPGFLVTQHNATSSIVGVEVVTLG